MAYSTIATSVGSNDDVELLQPVLGATTAGDNVFLHVFWGDPSITVDDLGHWLLVPGTNVTGPEYKSAIYYRTLTGIDDIVLGWDAACDVAWQTIKCRGLGAVPTVTAATRMSNSAALLPRVSGLSGTDLVLCFAAGVSTAGKAEVKATPDVGFITSEATTSIAGTSFTSAVPTLWVGRFNGAIGDLETTFPAAVYFDPPPTHAVGHTVAISVA
jgi:hypothetical protein